MTDDERLALLAAHAQSVGLAPHEAWALVDSTPVAGTLREQCQAIAAAAGRVVLSGADNMPR